MISKLIPKKVIEEKKIIYTILLLSIVMIAFLIYQNYQIKSQKITIDIDQDGIPKKEKDTILEASLFSDKKFQNLRNISFHKKNFLSGTKNPFQSNRLTVNNQNKKNNLSQEKNQ